MIWLGLERKVRSLWLQWPGDGNAPSTDVAFLFSSPGCPQWIRNSHDRAPFIDGHCHRIVNLVKVGLKWTRNKLCVFNMRCKVASTTQLKQQSPTWVRREETGSLPGSCRLWALWVECFPSSTPSPATAGTGLTHLVQLRFKGKGSSLCTEGWAFPESSF